LFSWTNSLRYPSLLQFPDHNSIPGEIRRWDSSQTGTEAEFMAARGQRIYVTVFVAAIVAALAIAFIPGDPRGEVSPRAEAQVIRPATVSRDSNPPRQSPAARKPERSARPDEIWQIIRLGRHRIGYSRTTFEQIREHGQLRVRTTSEVQMSVLRFGQRTRMRAVTRTLETASGNLLGFEVESGAGPNKSTMTGRLIRDGRQLEVETSGNGRSDKRFYDWRDGIKSPTYQDRMLRTYPMKPGDVRRFKTFDPQIGRVIEVRLAAENYQRRKLADGKLRNLLRVRVTQSSSPTEVVYSYLDETGRPAISESDFIGQTMAHYTVSKAEAVKAIQNDELDIGLRTILRTVPIPNAHKQPRIVYRISMPRDDPAKFVVADDRQRVRRIDRHTIELTVVPSAMPRSSIHVRMDPKYTAPSRYLQSNDRRVRGHALRAAGYETDVVKIALKMEKYVSQKLQNKNFSTAMATAAEVARDMQGDCTEHAVLLAAMLRARRIPSRIAIGLIYDDRIVGFVPHMWTEAWLGGKWVGLDATRGEGRVGAAHIKLAQASFADKSDDPITAFVPLMNVLGKWDIQVPGAAAKLKPIFREKFPR
jgi:transglutaminase-like putative cysteine protease